MTTPLERLRAALDGLALDGFILPVNDEFMGEYVPDSARRLEWLTGFTGSAGMAVVLTERGGASATTPQGEAGRSPDGGSDSPRQAKAAFFTDGRYTLQAQAEVDGCECHNSGELAPESWIRRHAAASAVIGYDPRLHSLNALRRYERQTSVTWQPVTPNPVDALWEERPLAPFGPVRAQPLAFAGETSAARRERIAHVIADMQADAALLTAPDSVCWLLNMRGGDVPFTPFALCYAVISAHGAVTLYLDEARIPEALRADWGDGVNVRPPDMLTPDMAVYAGQKVLYDPAGSPVWFCQQLTQIGAVVIEAPDVCQLPKACKNAVELDGMRAAHRRDGLALTKFLCWLDGAVSGGARLTEVDVAEKLESFRRASDLYLEPSFTTICGSGPNGAIVHYRATRDSNRPLDANSLLLVDSGGQYADGTTDVTRTVALGSPTPEMKERFTQVLKGHIALASAVFPQGTTGTQLDVLARQHLWRAGCDYDHGTGHGVGSHLSVHEGPQRISKRGGDVALLPGMILSNEPGYYKAGDYGIRIENLVAVVVKPALGEGHYLAFETLTLAPIDLRATLPDRLTLEEKQWLDDYHQAVRAAHGPFLDEHERQWLSRLADINS